jgi:5-methylcytosine-specific restriction endonuclease McrA
MNFIQIVGQIDKHKQRLLLGEKRYVELLLPPGSGELRGIKQGQYVQVLGDMWSRPDLDKSSTCLVRVSSVNPFAVDKELWARGNLTLRDPMWIHSEQFWSQSSITGINDGQDTLTVKMPLLESRWAKKVGGLVLPSGSVDLRVSITGASRLECIAIIDDNTTADGSAEELLGLPSCNAMDSHDGQTARQNGRTKHRRGVSPKIRRQVLSRDGFKCKECGAMPSEHRDVWLEIDHIIPVSKGGTNSMDNLQTLCDACNSGKSDSLPDPGAGSLYQDPWDGGNQLQLEDVAA